MKIGLQIPFFTWPGGAKEIGPTLRKIARTADQGGFDLIGVMDHFFQIQSIGPPEQDMLEAYTTLGYLAANTSRARLVTIVTGAVYRYPGVIAKIVTTLDVLSGGRGMLGIGAGWNEYEAKSLGIPFQPVAERFEWLEDTLRLCLQVWEGRRVSSRGQKVHVRAPAELAPEPHAAASADHDRRHGRAEDSSPRRQICGCVQSLSDAAGRA